MERLKNIELFVLDMDGTIYLGKIVLPCAREFVSHIKNSGKKIMYFTNNASNDHKIYIDRLTNMGFDADESEIFSAADVTAMYLCKNHPDAKVYVVGTPALENTFLKYGINLTDGTEGDIVVTSFDTTLTYDKLVKACDLIRNGAIYYCTHPDFNCPTENGFIPDSGAIAALVTASTGVTPRYFGKPYRETADMIAQKSEKPFSKIAVVGDRLYTDIALGKKHGILSVLVLSGETKIDDVTDENRADIIVDGIGDLIQYT